MFENDKHTHTGVSAFVSAMSLEPKKCRIVHGWICAIALHAQHAEL